MTASSADNTKSRALASTTSGQPAEALALSDADAPAVPETGPTSGLAPLPPSERGHYVYIVECGDHTYYTGWTTDVTERLKTHNRGKGAKYTRTRLPVKLLACWRFATKSEAMRFEHWVKRLPRSAKTRLLAQIQT